MAPLLGKRERKVVFLKVLSLFSVPFLHPFSSSLRGKSVEFRHVFCGVLLSVRKVYENILSFKNNKK